MIARTSKHCLVLTSLIALSLSLISTAKAADEVDNPQYTHWAKFKAGSSSTLTCDSKVGPNAIDIHIETTTTLDSVTPDEVALTSSSKVDVMGHSNNPVPVKKTIKAKAPAHESKQAGEKDVQAMGKTFKCKVFELTGNAAAANNAKGANAKNVKDAKATIYVNGDVPGGLVKMELTGGDGKTMVFNLTAMTAK